MKAPIAWEKAVLPAGCLRGICQERGMYMKKISSRHSAHCHNLTFKASYSLTADRGPEYVTNSHAIITSYSPFRPFTSGSGNRTLYIEDLKTVN